MREYYVDLHVHVGRSSDGRIVKVGTSHKLTFANIAYEARYRKGINIIGMVDCVSPWIIRDIEEMLKKGQLEELPEGGMNYRDDLVLLLGSEIETREESGCHAHSLVFFPWLSQVREFSNIMDRHMANLPENSMISRLSGQQLLILLTPSEDFICRHMSLLPIRVFMETVPIACATSLINSLSARFRR